MSDEVGWLKASDLQKLLDESGVPQGEEAQIEGLSMGYIRAKAKYADFVTRVGRVKSERQDWEIPRKLWMHRNSRFDVRAGTISGSVAIDEGGLIGMFGAVEFHCTRLMFDEAGTH